MLVTITSIISIVVSVKILVFSNHKNGNIVVIWFVNSCNIEFSVWL